MKSLQKHAINRILGYVSDKPMERLPKIIDIAEKIDRGGPNAHHIRAIRRAVLDKDSNWHLAVEKLFTEVDSRIVKKMVECFLINANLVGSPISKRMQEQHDCNIPWAILMDPTSACNLSCTGCWAAQYGGKSNLSYEMLDSICRQGKALGVYFYILSGGEPLVRKTDIIQLCETHDDCYFFAFTNGTLVDEQLCKDMLRAGNFALAFSIEGDERATDSRRGHGTYRKVIEAMARMKAYRLLYGYSTCYTSVNTESIGSDDFVDDMIERGCRFAWNFTYMPLGKDAVPDLLATPEQRAYMYRRVREIRAAKPLFAMDFWNDGEFVGGCIAGGRSYLHINAAGDVEPCAFVHYSNVNIHDVTLLDALKSPLFQAYRRRQPFNDNMLRPCPILDNPQAIRDMVRESGARSTEMEAPEDVVSLTAKTDDIAKRWAKKADRLWQNRKPSRVG